jgi:AraC-like DNA-binding protein
MGTAALPESCSRLTPLFRGALFAMDDWRCNGHDTPGRREEWCADDRIVVTRRGAWELEIAGAPALADPGTTTFWNRETAFRVRHPIGGHDDCTVFRLNPAGSRALRELSPAPGRRQGHRTFAHRTRPIDGSSYLLHRRVLDRARAVGGVGQPLAIEEPALALLRHLVSPDDQQVPGALATSSRRAVALAREIIARDFHRPLTISGIAREARCSPFHLSRLFRRATGVSLHRAVVRLRLREGLERVLDEPSQLSRIALDTGFASHSHFTDAFRAEYGCAPSEARRNRASRRGRQA